MENEEIVSAIQREENRRENLERLYLQNKRFIYRTARKYAAFADIDDLMQEAYFGLENAANTFESSRGIKFTTHLFYHLKAVFFRFVGHNTGINISVRDFELLTKYKRLVADNLSDHELCAALKITDTHLQTIKGMYAQTVCISLNAPLGDMDEQDSCLQDLIADDGNIEESYIEDIAKQEAARQLWSEVERLGGQQAQIIEARYKKMYTRSEAAASIGVEFNEARELERKAMAKLRKKEKLFELAEVYDCLNYHGTGLSAFRTRQMSNVEYVTLKKLELDEKLKDLDRL